MQRKTLYKTTQFGNSILKLDYRFGPATLIDAIFLGKKEARYVKYEPENESEILSIIISQGHHNDDPALILSTSPIIYPYSQGYMAGCRQAIISKNITDSQLEIWVFEGNDGLSDQLIVSLVEGDFDVLQEVDSYIQVYGDDQKRAA